MRYYRHNDRLLLERTIKKIVFGKVAAGGDKNCIVLCSRPTIFADYYGGGTVYVMVGYKRDSPKSFKQERLCDEVMP